MVPDDANVIEGAKLHIRNLLDILDGALYLQEFCPSFFEKHINAGCRVCGLVRRIRLDRLERDVISRQLRLPAEALMLVYDDLLNHWTIGNRKDLRPCTRCNRRFPGTEYESCSTADICRFCSRVPAASRRS